MGTKGAKETKEVKGAKGEKGAKGVKGVKLGETKSDKIITQVVTKNGDFIT